MGKINILETINKGADISIDRKPQDIGGSFNFGENDWQLTPNTIFRNSDQTLIDKVLYNNLDIVSDYQLFEKMKNYERKFNITSEVFYKEWINGKFESKPEFYDWAALYKTFSK